MRYLITLASCLLLTACATLQNLTDSGVSVGEQVQLVYDLTQVELDINDPQHQLILAHVGLILLSVNQGELTEDEAFDLIRELVPHQGETDEPVQN